MVDVDKLTDSELRTKLLEFGFPVMPITGTTRKVMAKKLKMLIENKEKISNENRRSLGRYSSEEDSDNDVKQVKNQKNRRITMAAPVMPAPTTRNVRKVPKVDEITEPEIPPSPPKREIRSTTSTTTTRTSKIIKSSQDDFDTGSESESDINKLASHANDREYSPSKRTLTSNFASRYSPAKSFDSSRNLSFDTASPGRYTSYTGPSASEYAADRLNQIRSRLSLGSPSSYDKPAYISTPIDDNGKEETPFLSNFTKKLSNISKKKNDVNEHETNGASLYTNARSYLGSYRNMRGRDYVGMNAPLSDNMQQMKTVSFTILAVAALFFLLVAVAYLGLRRDTSLAPPDYNVPLCDKTEVSTSNINCVHPDDVQDAINLMAMLKPELVKRSTAHKCFDSTIKPQMTEEEIVVFCKSSTGVKDEIRIRHDLRTLEILSFANDIWGINIVQKDDNNGAATVLDVVHKMEDLSSNYGRKITGLIVLNPDVPIMCSVSNFVTAFFYKIITLFAIFLIVYCIYFIYKKYKLKITKERDEISNLIERIIDILQSNESEDFVVINHARDMILPVNERKKKAQLWVKAVEYIKENESRVRTEVQTVAGEPYEVWRWIGASNLSMSMSGSPRNKSWQGQAFETEVGSVNSLPCSPTPCLKVRGMVEENERDTKAAVDAVLSKCADHCQILHCAADSASGCIYIKCAGTTDAAVAYRNLHGWWYSGHLVTVKYLRLERYMQRFPDSPINGPPFLKVPPE